MRQSVQNLGVLMCDKTGVITLEGPTTTLRNGTYVATGTGRGYVGIYITVILSLSDRYLSELTTYSMIVGIVPYGNTQERLAVPRTFLCYATRIPRQLPNSPNSNSVWEVVGSRFSLITMFCGLCLGCITASI